jgi:hypothetical protein
MMVLFLVMMLAQDHDVMVVIAVVSVNVDRDTFLRHHERPVGSRASRERRRAEASNNDGECKPVHRSSPSLETLNAA